MRRPYALGVRLAAWGGVAAAGLAIAVTGPGVAFAGATTGGGGGTASGNQLNLPVSVPIDICGNAVAALGLGHAQCPGGATVGTAGSSSSSSDSASSAASSAASSSTSGASSVASGSQISIPITIPINVCGNSVAVLGTATGSCQPTPRHVVIPAPATIPAKPRTLVRAKAPRPAATPRRKAKAPRPPAPQTAALPTTGVNLAGVGVGALALAGIGGTALFTTRRRR